MSDIYVQYEATVSVTHSVWRVFVRVPRAKIDQYRQATGDQTAIDQAIARRLSEQLAKRTPYLGQLGSYSLRVSYSDSAPPALEGRAPFFEADGMIFWNA
jgi:hypothetical protein